MDSQFNSLVQSYSSNYVQYKITGKESYRQGYTASQQGLDSILSQLQKQVDSQKASISDFYKSGVEQKLIETEAENRMLQRGILTEKDLMKAAELRQESSVPAPSPPIITTPQIIALSVFGAIALGLAAL